MASFVYRYLRGVKFRIDNRKKEGWLCPVCRYRGPFVDLHPPTGLRRHVLCPRCGARERHRLQHLVMERVTGSLDTSRLDMLHFAPERFFRENFRRRFGRYVTADLLRQDVDLNIDLCGLPLPDESFDFVYASHVLEHIQNDRTAIQEIWRVLRPGGIAVLPVPLVGERTVEYTEANPHEAHHWRAPGADYFERYREIFARVDEYNSSSFDEAYQLYVYEDRSQWPTADMPLRRSSLGEKHLDVVPVCRK